MPIETDHHDADGASQWLGTGEVVVLSRDVFFGMRIRTSLRQLGYDIKIVPDIESFTVSLVSSEGSAVLGLIDFNSPLDWSLLADAMATGVPVVAFGPHTDVESFRAAKAAGVVRVVANGEFSRSLPALVKRHAMSSTTGSG